MTAEQSVLKIYSDRTYTHTTMARHQGTTLAFAMDDRRRIVYTVLDLSAYDAKRGELDAAYWSENPVELRFPDEIVKVGYAAAGATAIPVVKKGGRTETGPGEEVTPEETDRFLSTTARLTAAAPFQVLSDGTHVVVLRQALGAADTDAVFTLSGGGASGNTTRTDFVTVSGQRVPVVADTLLCDRFLLVGGVLKPVAEIRFRRSRHKTRPDSAKDSLGAVDMDGRPFHEPTQELAFIRNLTEGRFTAVLTPTAVQGQQRWQFFAHNRLTGRIDSFNVEQGEDGLFNTQGSRYWTSPGEQYRGSVYERSPGICPFTGLPLVPVSPERVLAETALQLNGTNAYTDLGSAEKLRFQGRAYAVEAWVRPQTAGGPVLARWAGANQGGFQLRLTGTGQLILDHSGGSLTANQTLTAGTWAHVAASFNGTVATLYINGSFSGSASLATSGDGTAALRIGSAQAGGFLSGVVDEVRIWNRVRSQAELAEERGYRLIGNEPGLLAYYRLDEGTGTAVYDQTDSAVHGTVVGGAAWVTSEAPVSDHPGVRRDSFTVAGRDIVSGMSAILYHQQEEAASGYEDTAKPAKRQARVVLACATRPTGNTTADAHLATVDFGVGVDGRLAAVPDVLTLTEVGRPVEESADRVRAQEGRITPLEQDVNTIRTGIAQLVTEKSTLDSEIAAANAGAAGDPTKWSVTLANDPFRISFIASFLSSHSTAPGEGLALTRNNSARWNLMAVPGSTGRYGNPACVLVRLDAANLVAEPENGSTASGAAVKLTQRALTGTIPASAQWYVRGDWGYGVQFQNVASGHWLGIHTQGPENQAYYYTVEKKGIAPDPQLQLKIDRVTVVNGLLDQRNRDLLAKQADLDLAREELARLTGGLLGAADLILPVPHIGIDATGLSSAGALLKFARTAATPFLVDSAAGRVMLYFRGANGQFFAAYLDTAAVRGVQQLTGGGLTALFTARDPGVDLTTAQIRVTDCTVNNAVVAGLCDLTVTRGTETETFTRLPRRSRDLAAVVNGVSDEPVQVGTVASVSGDQVRLNGPSTAAVPAPAHLRVGTASYLVTTAAPVGSTSVRVTPSPPAGLTANTVVSLVRHDPARATASRAGVLLDKGSRWITVSADKGDLAVPNGTATARATGHGSRWRGDSPGRAFTFDSANSHRLSLPADRLDQITVTGDLTAEAWINPAYARTPRSRVLQVRRGDTKAALTLVDAPNPGGIALNGGTNSGLLPGADPTGGDFTIEGWLKRTAGRTVEDPVIACAANGLTIGFTATGEFRFGFGAQVLTTTTRYTDGDWHHWAVTFDRASRIQTIVRDGLEVVRRTATATPSGTDRLTLGRSDNPPNLSYFSGHLSELRIWNTARSVDDIAADKGRRVSAREPGLACAWVNDTTKPAMSQFQDISGMGRHGEIYGSPAAVDSALRSYRLLAAVGDKSRLSKESYPCGEWAHVAAVHRQSWALRFEGTSWAETADDDALDTTGDLTIEVFAAVDALGVRQGLLSKGRLGDGAGGSVPYQFAVRPDGKLEFAFEEPGPVVRRFASATAITPGVFHSFAVVRRAGSSTQEVKGTRDISYTNADGATTTQRVDVVERVDAKAWDDIRFVVDGTEIGTSRYTGPGPRGNDGLLEVGRAREGTVVSPLKGTIGEVRIWGRARETNQLGRSLQPRDEGLLARWTFEENSGNVTADLAGGHHLKLRGARWTADPDPSASSFLVYRNGQSIPCDTPAAHPLADWGDDQLTLGAFAKNNTFSEFFDGTLEEVRLWRTARAREQLLDSLFTRLKGDKQDLVAYWPFDSESTVVTADAVRDQSPRGNNLSVGTDLTRPRIVLSTAPVSTDTAVVRSALAGVRTPFQETISSPPAASEYADLQYTAAGEAYGVLKRAYAHITNGTWRLTTGYKVGDLVSEWVSQIQFAPQLIGYIEGAPPVPSENLTGATDPAGCAGVTFTQADEVTSTLSSARERSVDTSFSLSAGLEVDAQVLLLVAPLGFGTATPIADVSVKARIGGSFEFSHAWTDETSVAQGTATERSTSATLTGSWEDPARILNSDIGRRYVPANNGYALVQSETADVYALRLAHSGALVAYRIAPNPDIPKDWNIITFPINPQYTKQGTLDGAVGFNSQGKVLDPSYANAVQRGEQSYFKPREAYAIKRRILRERQQLESYYNSVSTETHDPDPTHGRAARVLESFVGTPSGAPEKSPPTRSTDAHANRNIANTYVWTADGGFFAETTNTVDVVSETTGGSYSVSGAVTTSLEVGFEVMGVGVGLQFDASLGGGMTVTRQRSKEASRSHSLAVNCAPTNDLQKYENGQPRYDTAGKPVKVPGKVDAYRFMTFYLGQDTNHFDDFYSKVIDPTWLKTSNDPNAAALRQAHHSHRKPPCWRVLHRVTFVSRILPAVPPPGAPPLEAALRTADVQSNYELIRRLDPYVSTATASQSLLAEATRTALSVHLPQLLPYALEITAFLSDYYGISE